MTILPLDLDEVLESLGLAGERLLYNQALTETDRMVATFAVALMLWMSKHEAALLEHFAAQFSDEMAEGDDHLH